MRKRTVSLPSYRIPPPSSHSASCLNRSILKKLLHLIDFLSHELRLRRTLSWSKTNFPGNNYCLSEWDNQSIVYIFSHTHTHMYFRSFSSPPIWSAEQLNQQGLRILRYLVIRRRQFCRCPPIHSNCSQPLDCKCGCVSEKQGGVLSGSQSSRKWLRMTHALSGVGWVPGWLISFVS